MTSTETSRKFITSNIEVWSGYAKLIGTNGRQDDARQSLHVAPAASEYAVEYLYIETNGDPVLVGWIEDGVVELDTIGLPWLCAPGAAWLRDLLRAEYGCDQFDGAEYQIAYVRESGAWDVIETFRAHDDDAANDYAEANHDGDWYVLRDGKNING